MAPVPASTRIGERLTRQRCQLTTLERNGSHPMPSFGPPNRPKSPGIDRVENIIRIEKSKGRKDRNVKLSAETLDLLR